MIESDIRGNINAECEKPMCHATACEMHHPDCTCDACCQRTDSICEDNPDQCEETHQPSGGKTMKNKRMPRLANTAVLLAVITISGLVGTAHKLDRPLDLNTGVVQPAIFDILNDEVVNKVEISSDVDVNEDVTNVDESFIALDYWRVIFTLANTIIDLDYIQPIGDIDIGGAINV